MEDRETSDGPGGPQGLISASFNQDTTSLSVGTKSGYRLFSVTSVDKMDCIHEGAECPDVYVVERLFSSSLVVVVSLSMPQRMNVYHFKRGTEICNYSYSNNILSVRLNRQRLVVCLEESVYIHNIKDMKLLKTLLNTPHNPSGLCALSVNHGNSYLAYPGSQTIGEIIVYDANNLSTVTRIPAHDKGQRLFEFRRGMKSREGESPTWGAYVGKMFTAASTYLPSQVSDMMHQDRAFATVRLNMFGLKNVCALSMVQKLPRLLVASSDGHLYIYNIDPQDGGECVLVRKHRLFEGDEVPQEAQPEEEEPEDGRSLPPSTSPSYAATDGGAEKGDVIPEHEFAEGPVCLDDENEFPPVSNQTN
ncbi:unnamed protein product [Coregonus sp. 'balchen']|nr:unnamed protein product [Coregonus sp. 'balchen']